MLQIKEAQGRKMDSLQKNITQLESNPYGSVQSLKTVLKSAARSGHMASKASKSKREGRQKSKETETKIKQEISVKTEVEVPTKEESVESEPQSISPRSASRSSS